MVRAGMLCMLIVFDATISLAQEVPRVGSCLIRPGTLCTNRNLSGAKLSEASLAHSQFTRSVLTDAELKGANLDQSDLSRADLRRADLRGASLRRANARGARFDDANLSGAKLVGTNFAGTDSDSTVNRRASPVRSRQNAASSPSKISAACKWCGFGRSWLNQSRCARTWAGSATRATRRNS